MERNIDSAGIRGWMGRTHSIREALASTPSVIPDTSFRNWPDEPERTNSEHMMTEEQLAYCHGFLRTDLHVLVTLLVAHEGIGTARQITDYLKERDLKNNISVNRDRVGKILREVSSCGDSGIAKESSDQMAHYKHNSNVEGLVMQAGYLFDFSRSQPKPLTQFIGTVRSNTPKEEFQEDDDFTRAADRIKIVRTLDGLWQQEGYANDFSTTRQQLTDQTGLLGSTVGNHLKNLADNGFLTYKTQGSRNGSYQTYQLDNPDKVPPNQVDSHDSLADYLREYALTQQENLTSQGAYEYILAHYPYLIPANSSEKDRLFQKVGNSFRYLKTSLLTSETIFSDGKQSHVKLHSNGGKNPLAHYSKVLDAMQHEDKRTVEKGMALGSSIMDDKQGVSHILQKFNK